MNSSGSELSGSTRIFTSKIFREQYFDRLLCCLHTRVVAIIIDHNFAGKPAHQFHLLRRQRRSQTRYDVANAELIRDDQIQKTFNQNGESAAPNFVARQIQTKKIASFYVGRCLGELIYFASSSLSVRPPKAIGFP